MPKQIMRRREADNAYLHKDFHAALNRALLFLENRFGADAVRDYVSRFAASHYAPLKEALRRRGIEAIKDHLASAFEREGGGAEFEREGKDLRVRVLDCPAVSHIHRLGENLSPLFFETTRAISETLCEGTNYRFSFEELDCPSGRCVQRFARRRP